MTLTLDTYAPPAALRVEEVSKSFGALSAVNEVPLTVESSSIHAVIGPNGAGKSTLLNLISGVVSPDSGSILMNGRDIRRASPERRAKEGIARTFQHPRLVGQLSIFENVLLGARLAAPREGSRRSRRDPEAALHAAQSLSDIGIPELDWYQLAKDVSPSNCRWVEIARLVASAPAVALLDEPNSGFTVGETRRLVRVLDGLVGRGVAVVLVTHDVALAVRASDRITVMHRGKHLMTGTPREVMTSRAVAESYLGVRGTALADRVLQENERGAAAGGLADR